MKNQEYAKLKSSLDALEAQIHEIDSPELEDKVYSLEKEINIKLEMYPGSKTSALHKLLKRISDIKKEKDFYDEEGELDAMFPDRHDDDFDEDSMSYDSVFGGD